MRKIALMILMIVVTSGAWGEINRRIESYDPIYVRKIGDRRQGGPRPFVGRLEFENLPEPLKPTRVNFTLEVPDNDCRFQDRDWGLRLHYLDNAARVTSDTVFEWPGPHFPGDIYTGYIEFAPLMSGQWGMALYVSRIEGLEGVQMPTGTGLEFEWCLDEDGQLQYLGNVVGLTERCYPLRTFFFGNDSVWITQYPEERGSEAFEYEILISPIPGIGDTMTIRYFFTANLDIPDGCGLQIFAASVDVVSDPERLDYAIQEGQMIEYTLAIRPKAVRNEHTITLSILYDTPDGHRHGQTVSCRFVFNEDGSLRYVNNSGFDPARKDIYPESFPWANAARDHLNIVWDSTRKEFIRK
jgi:hypothetical protein